MSCVSFSYISIESAPLMTFQSMLGPEGSIKNIQIRQIHIVYEPIIKVSRTITHVMCDFFLYVN